MQRTRGHPAVLRLHVTITPIGDNNVIRLAPDPSRWSECARPVRDTSFRAEFGLPTDRPVVMTGHQAIVFHPGVLAKYVAAEAIAARIGGAPAWLVVDHDDKDAITVEYPSIAKEGALTRRLARLAPGAGSGRGIPGASLPAANVEGADRLEAPAAASVERGWSEIVGAFGRHAGARSRAAQAAAATVDLMSRWVAPATLVEASTLMRSKLGRAWLQRIASDPRRCLESYNAAAATVPRARLRPLRVNGGRVETPLWRLTPAKPRHSVWSDELERINPAELAPKALLMTAMVRSSLCDVFVHGLGGAVYDTAMSAWIAAWAPDQALARDVVASADVRLQLELSGVAHAFDAERRVWLAHAAVHDPALLGDEASADRKRLLVSAIRAARERGENAGPLYRQMHELLAKARQKHRERMAAINEDAADARRAAPQARIANERAWAFPLHEPAVIDRLSAAIRERVS